MAAPFWMAAALTLLVSGGLLLSLRRTTDVLIAAANALVLAAWPLAGAMQRLTANTAYFWKQVEWAAIAVLPFTWMLYVSRYTGYYKRIRLRRLAWLSLFPLLSVLLLFTDSIHHLVWSPWIWHLPYLNSSHSFGPGLVWVVMNSFVATLICFLMLGRLYTRVRGVFRRQVVFLSLANWLPSVGLALDLIGWQIFPGLSATPYALMFAVLAVAWNVARFRFGDIVPVAREVVIDGLQDAVIVLDIQNRVIDFNRAALKVFPALQEVGTGQPVQRIWPDLAFLVNPPVETRSSHQWESNDRVYHVDISPLLDDRHQAFCRVAVLRDVSELMAAQVALQEANDRLEARVKERTAELTRMNEELEREISQRRQAAANLRASEARYRSLVETSSDIVSLYDLQGNLVMINPQGVLALGYERADDLVGKNALELVPPEDQSIAVAHYEAVIQSKGSTRCQYMQLRRDGTRFPVETSASLVLDDAGQPTGIVAITRDISEWKRAEQVLRESEAQLRASLREKEVLLREIHHRVKNNMQVISSLLSLAVTGVRDAESQQIFQESQNRIRTMGLIHEKLYQSHDLAHVDLRDYIESLTSYLFRSYSSQSANVSLELEIDEVYVSIDTAVPCGLILNELVSNALKHAFPHQKAGRIRVRFHRDDERRCTLEVSDNGVGLPEGAFNTGNTLGLRLVDALVKQLEGKMQLDSSLGTRFEITFASQ